jgi:hypothetical protein
MRVPCRAGTWHKVHQADREPVLSMAGRNRVDVYFARKSFARSSGRLCSPKSFHVAPFLGHYPRAEAATLTTMVRLTAFTVLASTEVLPERDAPPWSTVVQ